MAERRESRREVPVCRLGDHNHIQGETINRAQLPLDQLMGGVVRRLVRLPRGAGIDRGLGSALARLVATVAREL